MRHDLQPCNLRPETAPAYPRALMSEQPEDIIVGTITVDHVLTDDGLSVQVSAETTDGDRLTLVEALGMLRLAEAALLEDYAEDEGEVR